MSPPPDEQPRSAIERGHGVLLRTHSQFVVAVGATSTVAFMWSKPARLHARATLTGLRAPQEACTASIMRNVRAGVETIPEYGLTLKPACTFRIMDVVHLALASRGERDESNPTHA